MTGECDSPASTGSDGEAVVQLTFEPLGYLGYVDIEHKTAPLRNLRYFVPPLRTFQTLTHAQVFPRPFVADLYAALDLSAPTAEGAGPDVGTIGISAVDCDGDPLEGATVSVDVPGSDTVAAYFAGKQIDPTAVATDPAGYAVILMVPAGSAVVRLTFGDVEVGAVEVRVRRDAVTTLTLPPTPTGAWWQ